MMGDGYSHECEWCGQTFPCSRQMWDGRVLRGAAWYCSLECEKAADVPPSPDTANEDDWRADR
jgi:hypothetical protein